MPCWLLGRARCTALPATPGTTSTGDIAVGATGAIGLLLRGVLSGIA